MQIDEIHSWMNFIANKKLGSYFTQGENDAALHRGQVDEFDHLKKDYATSSDVQDALSPFKAKYTFTTPTSPAGRIQLPSDYVYILSVQCNIVIGSNVKYKGVKILSEDEIADRLNSQLRPVTATDPVAIIDGAGIVQLFPEQPFAGYVRYLKQPIAPFFSYTQTGRVITYQPITSVQMVWDDTTMRSIMMRALQYLGVSVNYGEIVQFTEQKINTPI